MTAKTYQIPIENDGMAFERITVLQRKAEKMGITFPHVTFGEPYKTITRDKLTPHVIHVHWWRDITLEGEGIDKPVSYGGWKIIGQFNHEYPKVILNRLSDDIKADYIQRFEDKNVSYCEDCQKQIYRHNTYVIENEETHNQMLIGSTCMHKYVPHQKSVDDIMKFYLSIGEMFNDGEDGLCHRGELRYQDTYQYLRCAFQCMLVGVHPKSEYFTPVMDHLLGSTRPRDQDSQVAFLLHKAIEVQEDAESEMYHMVLFIGALYEGNEFNVRLKRMCEGGYHLVKDNNTIVWGAVKYFDYIHAPRKAKLNSKWLGEVGQVLEVQVRYDSNKFLYSSEYGDSYLYIFKTQDGDIITWKTSYMDDEFLGGDMIIKGRIKELTEFNGVKQTQVTRARLRKL